MLLYSPRWLFLLPGLTLMLLGAAVGAWLLPGPRHVGGVELDVHTLLYASIAVLIGFQAVSFAVFSKVFAMQEGLVPDDPRFRRVFRYVRLESGLVLGALLAAGGLAGSVWAVWSWGARAFGPTNPTDLLRAVIPSATAMTLGCQVILSSFFLSVLGMRIRRLDG
jgi:hypothetical protein